MLQNTRVTAFTVSELFRKNQQGVKLPPNLVLKLFSKASLICFGPNVTILYLLKTPEKQQFFFVFSVGIKWESMSENGKKLSLISTNKLTDFVHFKYSLIFFH